MPSRSKPNNSPRPPFRLHRCGPSQTGWVWVRSAQPSESLLTADRGLTSRAGRTVLSQAHVASESALALLLLADHLFQVAMLGLGKGPTRIYAKIIYMPHICSL